MDTLPRDTSNTPYFMAVALGDEGDQISLTSFTAKEGVTDTHPEDEKEAVDDSLAVSLNEYSVCGRNMLRMTNVFF